MLERKPQRSTPQYERASIYVRVPPKNSEPETLHKPRILNWLLFCWMVRGRLPWARDTLVTPSRRKRKTEPTGSALKPGPRVPTEAHRAGFKQNILVILCQHAMSRPCRQPAPAVLIGGSWRRRGGGRGCIVNVVYIVCCLAG